MSADRSAQVRVTDDRVTDQCERVRVNARDFLADPRAAAPRRAAEAPRQKYKRAVLHTPRAMTVGTAGHATHAATHARGRRRSPTASDRQALCDCELM